MEAIKTGIQLEVNNQRFILLEQMKDDGAIASLTYKKTAQGSKLESKELISPGDMVMLLNYYRYQKEHNLPIF